jgi:hypothetical protein
MHLNDILEENTVKAISVRTNISEVNIDALVAGDFEKVKRVKTMGFISILEREYNADLSAVKKQALEYYATQQEDEGVTLGMPIIEVKKGKSKFFKFIVILLIGYALWYAFENFDKEKLNAMLPFSEEKLSKMIMPGETSSEELSIEYMQGNVKSDEVKQEVKQEITEENRSF